MNKKIVLSGFLFVLLIFLFIYMAGGFTTKISPQTQATLHSNQLTEQVETEMLTSHVEAVIREFPGRVVANQKATIAARLTATVGEVLVEVGSPVLQGDVLLRLESDDLDAKVRQSEQALSSAQAKLNASRSEYRRIKELLAKKLVSQSQYDQSESRLKTAQADLEHARAAISEAKTQFGYSIITAPFDGIITHKMVNKGDTATPGNELLSLYNPDSLIVETDVPESLLPLLSIGKALPIALPTYKANSVATIKEVSPAADMGSRSYLVRLDFSSNVVVYPGSYVKVSFSVQRDSVIKVPVAAVYQVGQLDYVRVLEKGEIKTRLVQLDQEFRVRKGLKAGDVVVLNPTSL